MGYRNANSKTALVLAGGGLSGAVYELGALRAIDDLLIGRTVNDFDIYVGTSAGSIVAAGLTNNLTPQAMLRSMEGTHPTIPSIHRRDLFQFNLTATAKRLFRFPRVLTNTVKHYAKHPHDFNLFDLLWELSNTLPSALYDGTALERYIRKLLTTSGISNHFDDLDKELYIIATSLEDGRRVVFGDHQHRQISISEAVTASSAVPLLYKPVRMGDDEYIDGGLRGNASLDIAIERGAKLVVCVNPLVPYDNSARFLDDHPGYLSDQGMQVVIDQVFRTMLHSGLHYHIKQLRRRHPDVDIILIEPRRDDLEMMFSNVMRYSTRLRIAKHGYESVTVDLEEDYYYYKSVLARHGVEINPEAVVVPKIEKVRQAGAEIEVVENLLDVHRDDETSALTAFRNAIEDIEGVIRRKGNLNDEQDA